MPVRRFRLITFDLDDTLWELRPVLERAEARVEQWLAANCATLLERHDRASLQRLRMELLDREPALRHRISALRREAMRRALLDAGYAAGDAAQLAEEAFAVFIAARHDVQPFAAVEQCLEELAPDYQLGVLTNGNADIYRLGLGRFFRFAIRAEMLGIGKPDAAHFRAALEQAGVQAHEAMHVGDHAEHDVVGAREAGMTAVWFNPGGRQWPGQEPGAHAELNDFAELPALVRELERGGEDG